MTAIGEVRDGSQLVAHAPPSGGRRQASPYDESLGSSLELEYESGAPKIRSTVAVIYFNTYSISTIVSYIQELFGAKYEPGFRLTNAATLPSSFN